MGMKTMATCVLLLMTMAWVSPIDAQVRRTRRRAVVKGEEGKGAAVGPRGAVVKTEEGYAAASRRGAVVKGDEGYAAVGRRGAVVKGEDGFAAVGRRGAVVAGEEGYAAVGASSLGTATRATKPGGSSPVWGRRLQSGPCSRGRPEPPSL